MKRKIKIAAIVIVASIALLLLGRHEAFLEMHYDTLDQRIVERTSLLGMTINETISLRREGYSQRYHSIYDIDPSDDRWHSVSMRPIRKTSLFTEYHLSVMTPPAVLFRNMIAEEIFKRYERDQSASLAKEAFSDLEAVLPSTAVECSPRTGP